MTRIRLRLLQIQDECSAKSDANSIRKSSQWKAKTLSKLGEHIMYMKTDGLNLVIGEAKSRLYTIDYKPSQAMVKTLIFAGKEHIREMAGNGYGHRVGTAWLCFVLSFRLFICSIPTRGRMRAHTIPCCFLSVAWSDAEETDIHVGVLRGSCLLTPVSGPAGRTQRRTAYSFGLRRATCSISGGDAPEDQPRTRPRGVALLVVEEE